MASVAVTFLLLAAIFMLRASAVNRRLEEQTREARSKLKVVAGVQERSLEALNHLITDLRGEVSLQDAVQQDPLDRFLVTVEFPENALYFAVGDDKLLAATASRLVEPLKRVVERVCAIDQHLTNSIVLEGHTNPQGRPGIEGYQYNVRLSALRAQAVYFAVRESIPEQIRYCMDSRFTVSGRGPVQPKTFTGRWDDPARPQNSAPDRRVVLKVRFTSGGEALAEGQ